MAYLANLPDHALESITAVAKTGIYFGYARVRRDLETTENAEGDEPATLTDADLGVFPMAMSLGYNPYYGNKKITAVCPVLSFLLLQPG